MYVASTPIVELFEVTSTPTQLTTQTPAPDPVTPTATTGIADSGGAWSVSDLAAALNEDTTPFGALKSDSLTGGRRPGANSISGTGNTWDLGASAFESINQMVTNAITGTPSSLYNLDLAAAAAGNSHATQYVPADPLVLDLNGDGVKLTGYAERTVLFDIDHDGGSKEQTGWVSPEDGIVVNDLNDNNKIDGIHETMSEYYTGTVGAGGTAGTKPYANGFAALKSLDCNADNQFTAADAAWSNVKVWQDANSNGVTDAGELKTLTELGITSINLTPTTQSGLVNGGNEVLATGTFTQNGATQQAQAASFIANPYGQTLSDQGAGTRIDAQTDGGMVATYVSHSTTGEAMNTATLGVTNLTGNLGNDSLTGDTGANWLAGSLGSDTFDAGAGDDVLLIDAEDLQANIHGGAGNDIAQVIGDAGITLNLAQAEIEAAIGGRGADILIGGGRSSVFIRANDGDDILIGGAASDALSGENGADLIDGGAGNDIVRGGRGQDQLMGGSGDDLVFAGQDDDRLSGGAGNDVLRGEQGDDHLDGGEGTDIAEFSGSFADYRLTQLDDTTWRVVDTKTGRDGADTLTGIEKLNFSDVSGLSLEQDKLSPLAVKDVLSLDAGNQAFDHTQAHVIAASQLLANDISWNRKELRISNVGDAQGGSISNIVKAADGITIISFTFTPNAQYQGLMGFKYSIVDSDNMTAQVTDSTGNTAAMKATVTLRTPDLPSDPLLTDQWYLSEANILPVWKDYTGKGVRIAQYELGSPFATDKEVLDVTHPDLKPNLDTTWLADPNNAIPQTYSNHATLVAGVMVGAKNGEGGVGVAYDAKVAGYWLANPGGVPAADYFALEKMKDYDIANNSWGSMRNFSANAGGSFQEQIDAATFGRNGLGTVMVFGGGNDRANGGNANYSNLSNSRYVIAVGAINATTDIGSLQFAQTPFSSPGANILVSAPGSNIASTSRLIEADNGSVFGADYATAQGTSFATPIISGIVALMLEANPNLGYRDVQEILALCAKDVNDPNTDKQYYTSPDSYANHKYNSAKNWNGGGMHFSNDYGFGEVDARAAVRLAETWQRQQTAANELVTMSLGSGNINLAVPNNNAAGVTSTIMVSNTALKVEHAEVTVNLTHDNAGDLIIKLISPTGTESFLMYRPGKAPGSDATDTGDAKFNDNNTLNFTFDTVRDWGESANGAWKLQVIDAASGDAVGTLNNWSLILYGGDDSSNSDQYVYTNEYTALAAANVSRRTLNDTDGGIDTINTAAIGGAVNINLTTGAANLNGVALTISSPANIENAIGGEYNDTLTGNATSNRLFGGRGNDVIDGGAGADLVDGGQGADVLAGGAGRDCFIVRAGDSAVDTINDFVAGTDCLVLTGLDGVTTSFVQQGADTRVNLSNGQAVLLKNVTATGISATSLLHIPDMTFANFYQSIVLGSDSNDIGIASTSGDLIYAGAGNDLVLGDPSSTGAGGGDTIDGGAGNDEVIGGAGNDLLIGGAGADYLQGDAGDDTIYLEGDCLADLNSEGSYAAVNGNAGSDRFVLTQTTAGRAYTNFVWDFEVGAVGSPIDSIDLSRVAQATSFAQLYIHTGYPLSST